MGFVAKLVLLEIAVLSRGVAGKADPSLDEKGIESAGTPTSLARLLKGGGGSSGSYNPTPACRGNFGGWGACNANTGMRSRTYYVEQYGDGTCPHSNGYVQSTQCPVGCMGQFGPWTACSASSKQSHTYQITRQARNGGAACPYTQGQAVDRSCVYTPPVAAPVASSKVMVRSEVAVTPPLDLQNEGDVAVVKAALCDGLKSKLSSHSPGACVVTKLVAKSTRALHSEASLRGSGDDRFLSGGTQDDHRRMLSNHQYMADLTVAVPEAKVAAASTVMKQPTFTLSAALSNVGSKYNVAPAQGLVVADEFGTTSVETRTVNFDAGPDAFFADVSCQLGGKVRFSYTGATRVVKMPDMASYIDCVMGGEAVVVGAKNAAVYEFPCAVRGTHMFARDTGCKKGSERGKVRVQVVDRSLTALLRATPNPANTLIRKFHHSYDDFQREYLQVYAHTGYPSRAMAARAVETGYCVLPHCSESSADFVPASVNTVPLCRALTYTAMGFASRKFPGATSVDFDKALGYYDQALAAVPDFCAAMGYRTEMYVQRGDAARAEAGFKDVCKKCGGSNLDIVSLKEAYAATSLQPPCGTACSDACPVAAPAKGGGNQDSEGASSAGASSMGIVIALAIVIPLVCGTALYVRYRNKTVAPQVNERGSTGSERKVEIQQDAFPPSSNKGVRYYEY